MPEVDSAIKSQLIKLCERLDRRARVHMQMDRYYEGASPLPPAIVRARVTKAYRMLMPVAEAPWGSLVVDSTQDRLEISGIDTGDKALDEKAWKWWQDNRMDAESKIAHNSALIDGRAFALVWPDDDNGGTPEIQLDNSATAIVQYREGSRYVRQAALRRWIDDDRVPHATLYRKDGIFKFSGPKNSSGQAGTQWEPRQPPEDAEWPMKNPFGVVPMVEVAINRRLKPGTFAYARGEYEHCIGLIDRINLLTFLGLVVGFYMGFPLRGMIGERILREGLVDDHGDPIMDPDTGKQKTKITPPIDSDASGFFQLENPNAEIVEYKAADRANLSVYAELDQLSTITKTPRHYFPMEGGMQNLAADAIRASEGALHAKSTGYKAMLGEGWEEVSRLGGIMAPDAYEIPPGASMLWQDHESRSLAERADAAAKLKDILPWQALVARVLNASQDEINSWTAMRGADSLAILAAAAVTPAPPVAPPAPPAPVVPSNGAGAS